MSKTILFATDYSPGSAKVLKLATTLAREEDAKLLIAHVTMLEKYPVGEHFNEETEPNPAELKQLKAVVPPDPNVPFEHRLLYGEPGSVEVTKPADEIIKLAKQGNVDMIVLGTHGRTGLRHLIMGSVAESLVRHAPCAVVSVKLPKENSEDVE
ncbi:Putative universal stress protein [Bremerella volcania]|uniref:Universal stress protein n=1 Tax=Bremerella volcania TaxID=2527984 RepID=A0A518C5Z8_9BACT|nr:universal stress protein [Bremerella volcania]QDU74632.1 Putative universal stress protein [Bremerella volcania]